MFNAFNNLVKTFLIAVISVLQYSFNTQHTEGVLFPLLFHHTVSKYDILDVIQSVTFNSTSRLNVLVSVAEQESEASS